MKMRVFTVVIICFAFASHVPAGFDIYFEQEIPVDAKEVSAVAFSQDGNHLAYGTDNGTLFLWDLTVKEQILERRQHKKKINCLQFSPDNRYLVTGADDKKIIIWDLQSATVQKVIEDLKEKVHHIDISPDGRYMAACGSGDDAYCWEFPSGHLRGRMVGHKKDVVFCAFNAANDRLITVGKDRQLIVWNIDTQAAVRRNEILIQTMRNSGNEIKSASLSADRRFLAVGIEETVLAKGGRRMEFVRHIAFYDWTDANLIKLLTGNNCPIEKLALSPDLIYALTDNSTLRENQISFWDILGGIVEKNYPFDNDISGFAFSLDGRWLAVAHPSDDGHTSAVGLWSLEGIAGFQPAPDVSLKTAGAGSFGGKIEIDGPDSALFTDYPAKTVAIIYFDAEGVEDNLARHITERLESKLVNNSPYVKVVERNLIDKVLKELKFSQSGLTVANAVKTGLVLDVEYMVLGTVRRIGHDMTVSAKAVSVETSQIIGARTVLGTNTSLRDISVMIDILAPTMARFAE